VFSVFSVVEIKAVELKKSHRFMLIFAVLVLAADQVTKYLVSTGIPLGSTWSPLSGPQPLFQIIHAYNTGAAFGLFQNMNPVFIAVAIVVSAGIVVYARQLRGDQVLWGVALGFILGGSLGNLIDRLRVGQVLDFIDIGIGPTRWYTSNLADTSIVLGVMLLGLALLRDDRRPKPAAPNTPELPKV
jgi:signal peptidase II